MNDIAVADHLLERLSALRKGRRVSDHLQTAIGIVSGWHRIARLLRKTRRRQTGARSAVAMLSGRAFQNFIRARSNGLLSCAGLRLAPQQK